MTAKAIKQVKPFHVLPSSSAIRYEVRSIIEEVDTMKAKVASGETGSLAMVVAHLGHLRYRLRQLVEIIELEDP